MMYRNKFLIVCFTVSVSVSMTELKSTGHFDRRPISQFLTAGCMNNFDETFRCNFAIELVD